MRRALIVMMVVPIVAAIPDAQARAGDPANPPRITELRWVHGPSEGEAGRWLKVRAVDPDGSIGELVIAFGDGAVAFVTLVCLEPGQPVRVFVQHTYPGPGRYATRVVALSVTSCGGGELEESPPGKVLTLIRS